MLMSWKSDPSDSHAYIIKDVCKPKTTFQMVTKKTMITGCKFEDLLFSARMVSKGISNVQKTYEHGICTLTNTFYLPWSVQCGGEPVI